MIYRTQLAAKGDMYRPIMGMSKQVSPGDSLQMEFRGHVESTVVAELRSPAVLSSYAFYVPHRLVWSQFPDFIADADTALTIPTVNTTTSAFASINEDPGQIISALFRRSVKLVYNTFFGDPDYGAAAEALYTDPLNDATQNTMMRLKCVNQLLAGITVDTDEPVDNYAVVASNIELTEFRRRLKVNARQNRQRIGGEKYTDALARFGVKVADNLINQPEMIGYSSDIIYPQETYVQAEVSTGTRVGRYRSPIHFKSKRIFCPEHGYVFVLHALRPFLARSLAPLERSATSRRFFMEEAEKPYVEINSILLGTATDVEPDPLVGIFDVRNRGDMHIINGATGLLTFLSNATVASLIYPQVAGGPLATVAGSGTVEFSTNVK